MANEIILSNGKTVDVKTFNKNLGNDVRKITIKCKTTKARAGNTFNSVKGMMFIDVIDDAGVNKGKMHRWLDVHFKKDAFKGVPAECEVHSAEDLVTGYLYVKAKYIQAPSKYIVREDEETGELKYPTIWIKGGIVGFEAYVSNQDSFDYHEGTNDVIEAEEVEDVGLEEEPDDTEEVII